MRRSPTRPLDRTTRSLLVETNERSLTDNAKAVEAVLYAFLCSTRTAPPNSSTRQTVALVENGRCGSTTSTPRATTLTVWWSTSSASRNDGGSIEGFDVGGLLDAAMNPGSGGAPAYTQKTLDTITAQLDEAILLLETSWRLMLVEVLVSRVLVLTRRRVRLTGYGLQGRAADLTEEARNMTSFLRCWRHPRSSMIAKSLGVDLEGLGDGAAGAGDDVDYARGQAWKELSGSASGVADVEEAMAFLGSSIAENGGAFDARRRPRQLKVECYVGNGRPLVKMSKRQPTTS